ncbi:MAG: 16S rRNA (cytosine(1402)-N(4))-methyltransferase RsmH [Sedimentisphaerales bacterium]|nr:16S rRNA (cytosine(1402)-N(4))-methyltransferase RsmH [Sedimentisphaerales bacterium]
MRCLVFYIKVNGAATEHIPVLADALAERVKLPQDAVVVDTTVGNGGHSLMFGKGLGPEGAIIGLDVDIDAIRRAQSALQQLKCRVFLLNSNFSDVKDAVLRQGFEKVDFILADLGVCSSQLDDSLMGLSFQRNMPLDMRLDKRLKTTAADIINRTDEKSLADLIYKFGEERASRRIAKCIVEHRRREKITTTGQLAAIVSAAMTGRGTKKWTRIHPATRTFQALRIAVNDELGNLAALLETAPQILKKDGRVAIISFHSLEDRLVKTSFRENEKQGVYRILTEKPVVADHNEVLRNRRARSAKLRIAQRN